MAFGRADELAVVELPLLVLLPPLEELLLLFVGRAWDEAMTMARVLPGRVNHYAIVPLVRFDRLNL